MPMCKRDGCREQAIDYKYPTKGFKRKQYCPTHYEEYAAKQRLYRERTALMPDCSNGCGRKALRDDYLCRSCRDRADNAARERQVWDDLQECETVDDLKMWIARHVKVER